MERLSGFESRVQLAKLSCSYLIESAFDLAGLEDNEETLGVLTEDLKSAHLHQEPSDMDLDDLFVVECSDFARHC